MLCTETADGLIVLHDTRNSQILSTDEISTTGM